MGTVTQVVRAHCTLSQARGKALGELDFHQPGLQSLNREPCEGSFDQSVFARDYRRKLRPAVTKLGFGLRVLTRKRPVLCAESEVSTAISNAETQAARIVLPRQMRKQKTLSQSVARGESHNTSLGSYSRQQGIAPHLAQSAGRKVQDLEDNQPHGERSGQPEDSDTGERMHWLNSRKLGTAAVDNTVKFTNGSARITGGQYLQPGADGKLLAACT